MRKIFVFAALDTGVLTGDNGINWARTNIPSGRDGKTLIDVLQKWHDYDSVTANELVLNQLRT